MSKKDAFLQFLKAARSLQNRGLSKEAILQFAKNEFGELSELFKKQIDSLFKPKKGIENIKLKDEVFDDTVVKLPFDDSGVPFNPNNPLKTKSLTYEEAVAREEARAAADEDYIMKIFDPEDFASGGRAGYYGGGQAMVEPDLSDIGHGSDALMARTRMTAPGSQATTSTGLNYLLGEDNDNVRVPFRFGGKGPGEIVQDEKKELEKIKKMFDDIDMKRSPDGIVMDSPPPQLNFDVSTLDRPDIKDVNVMNLLDTTTPMFDKDNIVKYDDGTVYYKDTDQYVMTDKDGEPTEVMGPSEGAKIVPKTVEAAEGGRIGFNDGLLVPKPKPYTEEMFEDESMTLLKGMYGTGKDSNKFLYNEMIKKGNILRNQGVEKETVIEIIRNNKDKINAFLETQTTSPKTLKGLADGGRINFQDGLNFDKAFEKMLEKETEEDVNMLEEGEKELEKKVIEQGKLLSETKPTRDKFLPGKQGDKEYELALDAYYKTEKGKKERETEMFEMVKEFQTLKKNGILRPDTPFERFKKMKTLTNLKNKILEFNVKYPEKKIINDEGMVDTEKFKEAVDQAEADLEISPIDGLTLKRSINTEGEQSVTSGSFDIGNLNFSSDNIEEGKLTSKGNYSFGDLDLSGMVNSNDGQILETGLGFNYDNALKGKMTNSDGYRSTELDLNKTFPINDKFNLNLKGSADTQTFDGKTYKSSDLTPKLSYNDGILSANVSKEILEGGDGLNLGAGVNYNNFYAKGDNLLSEDRNVLLGYQKDILDKDNLKFSIGSEINPITGKKTAGGYLKYNFAGGGIAGLRQGYSKGKGVDLARRGFLKVLGGTVGAIAAFKSGALKLLGKTSTTKAIPEVVKIAEGSGAPAWFEPMVNKVLADGLDITKKNATMDGQIVKSLDTPTGKVEVNYDTRSGSVDVNYSGENTAMGEGVDMRYTVNQADEATKVKPGDDFEAVESIPEGQMSSPNDYNVEFAENATSDVKGLYSDTSELAELGGQKPLIKDISTTIKKKQTLKKMNENPDQFASDNLPDYDPT